MSLARRRAAAGELWSGADRRALGYVRLHDARGIQLARYIDTLERLCQERGAKLTEVAVEIEPAAPAGAPPGLTWTLARLAAGEEGALVIARFEHLGGAFGDRRQAAGWFRAQGLTLIASEEPPAPPARARRGVLRSPGVGPRSWARYLDARTHARLRNC